MLSREIILYDFKVQITSSVWNFCSVVCKQLGYNRGRAHTNAYFGEGYASQLIGLDTVQCSGDEANLAQCGSHGWGVHDCQHSEDAAVVCDGNLAIVQTK